jgi:hypothetical protein
VTAASKVIGRRRMLQKALRKAGPVLRFSEHLSAEQGEAMFRGYKSGPCRSWLKVRNPAYERP